MAKRQIGDAVIRISYHDSGDYRGTVSAGGHVWHFRNLHAAACGFGAGVAYDSAKAYDEMAASAVSFGSYYTSGNRGHEDLSGYPDAETADAIEMATCHAQDDSGDYPEIKRLR